MRTSFFDRDNTVDKTRQERLIWNLKINANMYILQTGTFWSLTYRLEQECIPLNCFITSNAAYVMYILLLFVLWADQARNIYCCDPLNTIVFAILYNVAGFSKSQ
jgi:hypothetical protein